ncbi:syntaxin 7 [Strigomonas culicis]|nr:syntaxin 7 [Strigomonas culicis]|eukprot:EPY23539.1 syntaxin 7 [Strigomonas culicis]
MSEAQSVLQSYRDVCDQFYKQCISVEEASRGKMSGRLDGSYEDDAVANQEGGKPLPVTQAPTQKVTFEKDLYDDIMAERVRETNEIAENVKDINEIFQHINEMVGDQGAKLEIVDANVTAAENATRSGNQQLRRAQSYQEKTSRNKVLFMFLIVMIVLVFGSLIL